MANFTELVFEEQVLQSLLKEANAEMTEATQRREKMIKGTTRYIEMEEDIKNFRNNVIEPLRNKLVELDGKKKSACGISDGYITFNWKH